MNLALNLTYFKILGRLGLLNLYRIFKTEIKFLLNAVYGTLRTVVWKPMWETEFGYPILIKIILNNFQPRAAWKMKRIGEHLARTKRANTWIINC